LKSLGVLRSWPKTNYNQIVGCTFILFTNVLFIMTSPFMFVFGDDSVIRYTGAYDITSDVSDA